MIKKYWKEICVGAVGILAISNLWNNEMPYLEKGMRERIAAETELEREISKSHFIIRDGKEYYLEYNRGWLIEIKTEESEREQCMLYRKRIMIEMKRQEEIKKRSRDISDHIINCLEGNGSKKFESIPMPKSFYEDRG